MNHIANRGWIDYVLSPQRFNEVTRIADSHKAKEFFKDSALKLIQPKLWVQPIDFCSCYKIKCFDKYGFETDRVLMVGDKIKLSFNCERNGTNTLWLKVIDLSITKEHDGYEEELFLLLRETSDNRYLYRNNALLSYAECAITLKRLINTISLDMKIKPTLHDSSLDHNNEDLIQLFDWPRLMKNILSQL